MSFSFHSHTELARTLRHACMLEDVLNKPFFLGGEHVLYASRSGKSRGQNGEECREDLTVLFPATKKQVYSEVMQVIQGHMGSYHPLNPVQRSDLQSIHLDDWEMKFTSYHSLWVAGSCLSGLRRHFNTRPFVHSPSLIKAPHAEASGKQPRRPLTLAGVKEKSPKILRFLRELETRETLALAKEFKAVHGTGAWPPGLKWK